MGGGGGDEPDEALTMTTPRKGWWKKGIALLIFYGALLSALSNDGLVPREVSTPAAADAVGPDAGLANATNATGLARVLDGGGATTPSWKAEPKSLPTQGKILPRIRFWPRGSSPTNIIPE